jgi:hypothetical protein
LASLGQAVADSLKANVFKMNPVSDRSHHFALAGSDLSPVITVTFIMVPEYGSVHSDAVGN